MKTPSSRMLVTRTEPGASRVAASLAQQGIKTVVVPTVAVTAMVNQDAVQQAMQALTTAAHVIVVSPQVLAMAQHYWPSRVMAKVVAMGPSTAHALQAVGIKALLPSAYHHEAVLAMPHLAAVQQQSIVICSGCSLAVLDDDYAALSPSVCAQLKQHPVVAGTQILQTSLQQRGAHVTVVDCYQRVIPYYNAETIQGLLAQHAIDRVLISSAEGLRNLLLLAGPYVNSLHHLPLLVISERIAHYAKLWGLSNVIQTSMDGLGSRL